VRLRDFVLQSCAIEVTLCSQAVTPNLEDRDYEIELITPKSQLPQEGKIEQFQNVCLNLVTNTQDFNRFELPQSATADGSAVHKSVKHFQKQAGEWCLCKYCGKCYSDQKKLATHQREDCGNGPGFQCPYCCVKLRRKGNFMLFVPYIFLII
jgi:uncharacterized Zn-finger protein